MKDLLLPPSHGNQFHFPWLMIFSSAKNELYPKGHYFLTYGRNFSKFDNKPGFRIVGHIRSRDDAIACCKWHNAQLYPPKEKRQSIRSLAGVDPKALKLKTERQPKLFVPKDFIDKRTKKDG